MGVKAKVIDTAGNGGRLLTDMPAGARAGTIAIALDDARHVVVPHERLIAQDDGAYRLDGHFDEFEVIDPTEPAEPTGAEEAGSNGVESNSRSIPLGHEEVSVERRRRPIGKLRLEKHVETEEVMLDEHIDFDEAEIERVPIGEVVDEPPRVRREGDTIVIPVLKERLLKQVVLVEEVRVRRRRHTEEVSEPVTLRRERIDISHERMNPDDDSDEHRRPRP